MTFALALSNSGTVDDFNVAEKQLKPTFEQFVKDRPSFVQPLKDCTQYWGAAPAKEWGP